MILISTQFRAQPPRDRPNARKRKEKHKTKRAHKSCPSHFPRHSSHSLIHRRRRRRRSVPIPTRFLPIQRRQGSPTAGRDAAPVPLLPVTAQHPQRRERRHCLGRGACWRWSPQCSHGGRLTDPLLPASMGSRNAGVAARPPHRALLLAICSGRSWACTRTTTTARRGGGRPCYSGSIPGRSSSWRWKTFSTASASTTSPAGHQVSSSSPRNSSVLGLGVMTASMKMMGFVGEIAYLGYSSCGHER
jgi:hypothetical protein